MGISDERTDARLHLTRRRLLETAAASGMVAVTREKRAEPQPSFFHTPATFPVSPYTDYPGQLAPLMPWLKQSFYLQPWRGYLETVPATQFLNGIGMVYTLPQQADHEKVIAYLAGAGVRALRVELPWTDVPWSENKLDSAAHYITVFSACRRAGIMPLVLLNANDGAPCPSQSAPHTVVGAVAAGARSIQLDRVNDLVAGRSGLSNLPGLPMAGILFTAIDQATRTVTLSRPLPQALADGAAVTATVLKYPPLYPVGTPEFAATSAGWLKYILLVCELLKTCEISECCLEMWNELSFGSAFTQINNYYDPPLIASSPDFLNPGGCCWELARQTEILVSQLLPQARMIWGFSNTTFYQTAIKNLPPGYQGQSYHPYGTGKAVTPKDFPPKDRYSWFIEGYVPQGLTKCMPEGWAHLGIQTEQIIRLLYPPDRLTTFPPQSVSFDHYMTEHGFVPGEAGITGKKQAQEYKAKCLIRALLFWLNKGIYKMCIYCAYDGTETGMGMMAAGLSPLIDSPALAALRRLTEQFAGAAPLTKPTPLTVKVTALDGQPIVFKGDAKHPSLPYREMFTFLPFQVTEKKFICGFYVMSYDITQPPPAMGYIVTIAPRMGALAHLSVYEPLSGTTVALAPEKDQQGQLTVRLHADDIPRLLIFEYV